MNKPFLSLTSQRFIEHRRYNPDTLNNDIAMIKLPKPITYTTFIHGIRLPTLTQAVNGKYNSNQARVCGFGKTSDGEFLSKVCVMCIA